MPNDGGWDNKQGGKTTSEHDRKTPAVAEGKDKAKDDETEHVIHGKDGKIQESNSYGNDPNPPKDKK